jgi:bacterioferritin
MMKMDKKLADGLQRAVAREIQVSIQYMWQHVVAKGVKGKVVADDFKAFAVQEMKHAEEIAERLDYYGIVPTTQPSPIKVGGSLDEMLDLNIRAEEEAIALYRDIIQMAAKGGDEVTALMFREILKDEEEHLKAFRAYKED